MNRQALALRWCRLDLLGKLDVISVGILSVLVSHDKDGDTSEDLKVGEQDDDSLQGAVKTLASITTHGEVGIGY